MEINRDIEDMLRLEAPQVLGALVRRYGHFDVAEEAVQESLLAAAQQWPADGMPDRPRGWLIRVASRAMTDILRSELARRTREAREALATPVDRWVTPGPDARLSEGRDDSLVLLLMCCHPALPAPAQIALTLRAVGGLTTEEIARGFMVPTATMAQRISRAKASIAASGMPFQLPAGDAWRPRLATVLRTLYLIFNEGYVASAGDALSRVDISGEAIRLTRMLNAALPDEGEVAGLLAIMLLTDARRAARVAPDGSPVPIAEQDRTLWDADLIAEGTALVHRAMRTSPLGAYQVQAAIAALHDEASRAEDTDWPQILALYTVLLRFDGSPMVALNRAVAVAMVQGPRAGLEALDDVATDRRLAGGHRVAAVRGHLLEMNGDSEGARVAYLEAARRTLSTPERHHLQARADRLLAGPTAKGALRPPG
jgi:predicted RNA polymerase sigma factor